MPGEIPHTLAPSVQRPKPLTAEQRKLITSIVPVLEQHGKTITTVMYNQMLEENPALKNIFSKSKQERGQQPDVLARSLYAYASHIEDLGPILPFVERIANKHASVHVEPEHYDVVGKYLTSAIIQVVGADVFKGELYDAWIAAYWNLAYVFIDREHALYKEAGWVGWRDFVVEKKIQESDEVTSFYLRPKDGKALPPYRPGQYISVQRFVPQFGVTQNRQYSLSDAPTPDHYRISVKREAGLPSDAAELAHPGTMSNVLHGTLNEGDTVELAYPFGEFFLDASSSSVVLLSAGVGVTPLLAMLNTLVQADGPKRSVSSRLHPFGEHVASVAKAHPEQVSATMFYSDGDEADARGKDFVVRGRLDVSKLDSAVLKLDDATTNYYVCGPDRFMADVFTGLKARGVDVSRLHAEVFGAGMEPQ
ncbi:globin-like protein [Ganoderma leucocontextum]|nr:globin-like protein [Ganoderma leucocontextum]